MFGQARAFMQRDRRFIAILITWFVIIADWKIAAADTTSAPGTTLSNGQQVSQPTNGVANGVSDTTANYEALPIKHWIILAGCSLFLLAAVPLVVRYLDGKENYSRV